MTGLHHKHRNAEITGDVFTARKSGKALDNKAQKELKRNQSIMKQVILIHQCQDKAIPEQVLSAGNVVVDGGTEQMTPLPNSLILPGPGKQVSVSPRILRLLNDDLKRIRPSADPCKGTALYYHHSSIPVFIVVPRNTTRLRLKLHDRQFSKKIRHASRKLFKSERYIPRGRSRWVIFDNKHYSNRQGDEGYVCLGPKVQRSTHGVSQYSKHANLPKQHDLF